MMVLLWSSLSSTRSRRRKSSWSRPSLPPCRWSSASIPVSVVLFFSFKLKTRFWPLCFLAVVLNVLSYSKAYCLYPIATFVERRNLVISGSAYRDNTLALRKYKRRGWSLERKLTGEEAFAPDSPFATGIRYLGDSLCWTIPLYPPKELPPSSSYNIECNRWMVYTGASLSFRISAIIFVSPRLKHGYIFSPCMHLREVADRFRKLKSANGDMVWVFF